MKSLKWIKNFRIPKLTYKFKFFAGALACYISIVAIITILIFPRIESKFEIGGVASKDHAAPYELSFVNTIQTSTLKSNARNSINPITVINQDANTHYKDSLTCFLHLVQTGKEFNETLEGPFEDDFLKDITGSDLQVEIQKAGLSEEEFSKLRILEDADIFMFSSQITEIQNQILLMRISDENIDGVRDEVTNRLRDNLDDKKLVGIGGKILNAFTGINTTINNNATETARLAAEFRIQPVMETIHKDEIFLRNGEVINERHLNILSTLYEPETRKAARARIKKIITMACLTLAAFFIYWYF